MSKFLVTGGAGFIGSHFSQYLLAAGHEVIVLDKLTYAGHRINVPEGCRLIVGDICDAALVSMILTRSRPDAVFNFAAESHVCRSIAESGTFIRSNISGTHTLLTESLNYWRAAGSPKEFRYVQVSTDEVFGDLNPGDAPFTEFSPLKPNSPYAASKCSADLLVRSFAHTYELPVITTHCSNNYGPQQYPEKLIPLAVCRFLSGEPFTVHGDGSNIRDWLWVGDHCRGIFLAYERGTPGRSYCFGGNTELTNLDVVEGIAHLLGCRELIKLGPDRPGNDRRYAINAGRARAELGWQPYMEWKAGLLYTVTWYKQNPHWITEVSHGK